MRPGLLDSGDASSQESQNLCPGLLDTGNFSSQESQNLNECDVKQWESAIQDEPQCAADFTADQQRLKSRGKAEEAYRVFDDVGSPHSFIIQWSEDLRELFFRTSHECVKQCATF